MDPRNLRPADYKGAFFAIRAANTTGGRRVVRKRFPGSDRQSVEDLGLDPREFVIRGVVTARRDASGGEIQSYEEVRRRLLAALESGGSGPLTHPTFGRLESIAVVTFSLSEDISSLGDSPIEITFAVDDSDGRPRATESVVGSVGAGAQAVSSAADAQVEADFEVTDSFTGNFADALEKVLDVVQSVREAVSVIAADEDQVDAFDKQAGEYEDTALDMLKDSSLLGERTVALVEAIVNLYTDSADAYDSLTRLFDFGDDDVAISPTTSGLTQRKKNRDALDAAVQADALGRAYLAAANLEFESVDDVEVVDGALETQWQKLLGAGVMNAATEEALAELRVTTKRFFDEQRDIRPQVVEVETQLTSTRLLAYRLYGDSSRGSQIARLNGFVDGAGIVGVVKVLSA